ncbi:MAG: response regulator [Planctomycetes bacterium]|nr:response regulator [Planctomycetota bacterium]
MFGKPMSDGQPARVLVVDDEPLARDLLVRWMKEAGYVCAAASQPSEAWEHLQTHEVELATLDVRMPGESGTQLLHRIATTFPDVSVLMLTGVNETRTAIEALTQGACGYLLKPVEREELLFQAQRALERRRLILENRAYTEHLEAEVRRQTLEVRRAHEETVYRLIAASSCRDGETGAHIRRTGLYSEVLAEMAGCPPGEVENIRLAAPMHDVGKIGIPDAVLCKPGKLTAQEYEVMKTHTDIGGRMLAGSHSPMLQMAERIARHHHERWDGKGYPAGLSGLDIPECARIVSIVDVYDAVSHDRVYRPAMPEPQVLQILEEGRGTHFDPDLLRLFFVALPEMRRIAQEYPDECFAPSDATCAPGEPTPVPTFSPLLGALEDAAP